MRLFQVSTFRRIAIWIIKERYKSRGKPLRGIALPAPKISEILESLAFLKGSKISDILKFLGSPQKHFRGEPERLGRAGSKWPQGAAP